MHSTLQATYFALVANFCGGMTDEQETRINN